MNLLVSKEARKKVEDTQGQIGQIYGMTEDIGIELERCKMISKHESTQKLINLWDEEYQVIGGLMRRIQRHDEEFQKLVESNKIKKAKSYADDITPKLEETEEFLEEFLEKLKKFTSYEYDSVKMALNLKERLKEINLLFDQNLKVLDIYNVSFIESVSAVNYKVTEFEELQTIGEYPRARKSLKDGEEVLAILEEEVKNLTEFQQLMREIERSTEDFEDKYSEILAKGFINFSNETKENYFGLMSEKKRVEDDLKVVEFLNAEFNFIEKIGMDIAKLNEELKEFMDAFDESVILIKTTLKTDEANKKLTTLYENLLDGALEEKDVILKLYNLTDSDVLTKVEQDSDIFDQFKRDYAKLEKMMFDESKEFTSLNEKVTQSNMYLNKILENLKENIKMLQSIRHDELEIRARAVDYEKELINIEFYLRENKHYNKMNKDVKITKKEIREKLSDLHEALRQEVLDITYVRSMDNIVDELMKAYIKKIHTDIKQKNGAEKLILYFNKSIKDDQGLEYAQHFTKLYNSFEYRRILREIYQVLIDNSEQGEELYKDIVNTVEIKKYEGMM